MEKGIQTEKRRRNKSEQTERPIADLYSEIDNDLARDNIENDLSYADLQDM